MVVMTPRARPNSKAALALLVLAAIILAALVDGADAAKRPPPSKKNKGKNKKSPSSSSSLAFAAAPAVCNPACANGAGCVKGQCKCHPGSSGPACATLLPGYFFDTKVNKPMQCPVNFYCRGGAPPADTLPVVCPVDTTTQGAGKSAITDCTPVRCGNPSQCSSLVCSREDHRCLPATCQDNVKNGAETDRDCGGPTCGACADGKACSVAADCSSGVCANSVCQAPSCIDGVKNGDEVDVDCGGASCGKCADLKKCLTSADCLSGVCTGNVCQAPTCSDNVQNGAETDSDCGGGTCAACADSKKCALPSDCASKVCKDGTCPAPTCLDGVKNGVDETDVDCGGSGGCPACADSKACSTASDCLSGVCTGNVCQVPTCSDGVKNGGETDIDCGGPACGGSCVSGSACALGGDCSSGVCTGEVCQVPSCFDGIKNGDEADVDCGGGSSGCGVCADGKACLSAAGCSSGVCAGSVCQVPTCSDGVKNGVETDIDCGGASCSTKCAVGKACIGNGDCASGACSAGTCQAGGGLTFSGVQSNVPDASILQGGFTLCYKDTYGNYLDNGAIENNCNKGVLLVACRPSGSSVNTIAAMGLRSDVLYPVPMPINYDLAQLSITHLHNNVQWYYTQNWSMGFAPEGVVVARFSCDVGDWYFNNGNPEGRLCWHWGGSGYRCSTSILDTSYERVVYHRAGGL